VSQKTVRPTSYLFAGRPNGAIAENFGMRNNIADVIIRAKFCDDGSRGFPTSEFCHPYVAILHKLIWSPLKRCKQYRATVSFTLFCYTLPFAKYCDKYVGVCLCVCLSARIPQEPHARS